MAIETISADDSGRFVLQQKRINQRIAGSRRRPQPPRSFIAQAGSFKSVLTWNAPQDTRGITEYIVYLDNESSPYMRTSYASKRMEIPIASGGSRLVAVSSVNSLGIESPKIPTIVTAGSDTYNGGSAGTSPPAPPEWPNEPTGGGRGPLYYKII